MKNLNFFVIKKISRATKVFSLFVVSLLFLFPASAFAYFTPPEDLPIVIEEYLDIFDVPSSAQYLAYEDFYLYDFLITRNNSDPNHLLQFYWYELNTSFSAPAYISDNIIHIRAAGSISCGKNVTNIEIPYGYKITSCGVDPTVKEHTVDLSVKGTVLYSSFPIYTDQFATDTYYAPAPITLSLNGYDPFSYDSSVFPDWENGSRFVIRSPYPYYNSVSDLYALQFASTVIDYTFTTSLQVIPEDDTPTLRLSDSSGVLEIFEFDKSYIFQNSTEGYLQYTGDGDFYYVNLDSDGLYNLAYLVDGDVITDIDFIITNPDSFAASASASNEQINTFCEGLDSDSYFFGHLPSTLCSAFLFSDNYLSNKFSETKNLFFSRLPFLGQISNFIVLGSTTFSDSDVSYPDLHFNFMGVDSAFADFEDFAAFFILIKTFLSCLIWFFFSQMIYKSFVNLLSH